MSAIAVIGVVLAFPAAFIARRMGLKNVILLSVACLGVGSALGGATADLNVLMASRLLEGVGIGLYLTRQIAEKQGGYVKVESMPGRGSTFSLYIPRES